MKEIFLENYIRENPEDSLRIDNLLMKNYSNFTP